MNTISAHCWFRRHQAWTTPQPPRAAITLMLAEIADGLRRAGWRPVAVKCGTFEPSQERGGGEHNHLARITVTCEPGDMARPLASWFEWQHPRWEWDAGPAAIDGQRALVLGAAP